MSERRGERGDRSFDQSTLLAATPPSASRRGDQPLMPSRGVVVRLPARFRLRSLSKFLLLLLLMASYRIVFVTRASDGGGIERMTSFVASELALQKAPRGSSGSSKKRASLFSTLARGSDSLPYKSWRKGESSPATSLLY